jgi:hypothetical protein
MDDDGLTRLRQGLMNAAARISGPSSTLGAAAGAITKRWEQQFRGISAKVATFTVDPRAQEILDRYTAATETLPPKDPKRQAWEIVGDLTPRQSLPLLKYLPDPFKRRGHPGGTKALDQDMCKALAEADRAGEPLTTAAKRVLADRGMSEDEIKSKADYAVKLYKDR